MEIEKMKIPQALQKDGFGFVRLKARTKIPFEQDWQNKPYSLSEIEPWFESGNNYGVLGGYGDLIVIDADTEEISTIVEAKFPATFTVKTRKGFHYYYLNKDIQKKIVLKKGDEHYGEIIAKGSQVVAPGSVHPDTGVIYSVHNDVAIAHLSRELVYGELIEYIPFEYPQRDAETEVDDISVVDVLNKAGVQLKRIGGQLVCSHPVHGSTNNNNFVVHPDKNVWHCFRCGSGGGAMALVGVLEGIIDCREAVPGGLRGDKFTQALKVAKDKYGFDVKISSPAKDEPILSEDKLAELEKKIKAIPQDTHKAKIPALLDNVLKEMAGLNQAQADAILKYTIKDHFSFTNDDLKGYEKVLKGYRKEPKETESKRLSREDLIEILTNEEGSRTVHPAQDFSDGIMSFAVAIKDTLCLVTSDKRLCSFEDAESEGIVLKHTSVDTARFSYKGIRTFVEGNASVSIPGVYWKVYNYIKRFICFPDDSYLSFITLWVMGTYLFMIFRYYPYVWLNAEKGSGKTLLMEILSSIAFNGELITNPTESVIFRDISNNLIAMFIDEVEQLRKRDKDTYGSLISLLNAGFNKAGVVKRTESTGQGGFVVKSYSAYSPKMFAGINEIDDVLQDRTVRIPLLRKKDDETVQRYKERAEIVDLQRSIRDELYMFALIYAKDIAEVYHAQGDVIQGMSHLNNRELDIWEPVFLLANVIDSQTNSTKLTDTMEALSKKSVDEKQSDSVSQNETYKLLNVVKVMLDEVKTLQEDGNIKVFDSQEVFEYFQKSDDYDWIQKKNALTSRLKRIKIKSDQKRIDGDKKRVYIMDVTEFKDLCERFKI